jgi:hypothetical protein
MLYHINGVIAITYSQTGLNKYQVALFMSMIIFPENSGKYHVKAN